MKIVPTVAVVTATLSVASWTYRFVDEHMRYQELIFYILVPTSGLWVISILVGFYGLRIH